MDRRNFIRIQPVERRSISKLRLGILPLRLETARYARPILPEHEQVCYCNSGEVESEFYVLFQCKMYNDLTWLENLSIPENFNSLPKYEKLKLVLTEATNVRLTAQFIVSAMDRRSLLNKVY